MVVPIISEGSILIATAASIALLHTLIGPDHYIPFVAMAKARQWSLARTLRITLICGAGHVLSSMLLGVIGIALGSQLTSLVAIEGARGNWAAWALVAFGLLYLCWGLSRTTSKHRHRHGGIEHSHPHNRQHLDRSRHSHAASITPWALFIVFVLGPCEALIPLLMYPAAQHNAGLVLLVAVTFGVVTLLTMLAAVAALVLGLNRVRLPRLDRYAHAMAGASIVICGAAINLFGL